MTLIPTPVLTPVSHLDGHRFRQLRYPETLRQYVFGQILRRRSRSLSLLGGIGGLVG
jgi:hypothetical protein